MLAQPRSNPWPKDEMAIDHADSFLCAADEFDMRNAREVALFLDFLQGFAMNGMRILPWVTNDEVWGVRQQVRDLSRGLQKLSMKAIPEEDPYCPEIAPEDEMTLKSISTKCIVVAGQCRTAVEWARTAYNSIHKIDTGDENKENQNPCNTPAPETSDEDYRLLRVNQKSWDLLSTEEHESVFDRMEGMLHVRRLYILFKVD